MAKRLLLCLLLVVSVGGRTQSDILDRYVREGLENNLALKQKEFSLDKSLEKLQEARGKYLPRINIESRFSKAGGGREFVIPVGDLMNPVYQTLNDILIGQGQPPRPFPTLENEVVPFLPEEEQQTKVRVVQPLFEPVIYYNIKIHSSMSRSQEAERDVYRRRLVADIKTAYYNYLKTMQVLRVLEDTRSLLEENLRVSRLLFETQKATGDVVFRAQAELSRLDQNQAIAERDIKLAASYFNFLLNRSPDASIEAPSEEPALRDHEMPFDEALESAFGRREEFDQMESAIEAAQNSVKLSTSRYLPSIDFVFDYGVWSEAFTFDRRDDYWMGSLMFQWNIFDGFQKKAKRDYAILERRELETRLDELESQVRLQVQEAVENVLVARKAVTSALDRVSSARKSFRIIRSKYREGMSQQVEFLDAQSTLTGAEINQVIAKYEYQIKCAELERIAALLDL